MTGSSWCERWTAEVDRWCEGRDRVGVALHAGGAVAELMYEAGSVVARIQRARNAEPLRVDIGFPSLRPDEIQRVRAAVAASPRLTAELMTGSLPDQLGAAGAEVALIPPASTWSGDCACGEWASVCEHQAAVARAIGEVLLTDPFALLTLRGTSRDDLVGPDVNATASGGPRGDDPGIDAAAAFSADAGPPPAARPAPWAPVSNAKGEAPPPTDSGLSEATLAALVGDASSRAIAVLRQGAPSGLALSRDEDLVRRLAAGPQPPNAPPELGWSPQEVVAAVAAWRTAGAAGLRVLRERWEPPAEILAEVAARLGPRSRVVANVIAVPGAQLRMDRDGRWWRLRPDDELGWVLATEGFDDPADSLDAPDL